MNTGQRWVGGPDRGFEMSLIGDTDAGLLARCGADPESLGHLFDRHADSVHRCLARRVGSEDADILLADVFLAASRARDRYDPKRPDARAWLLGMGVRASMPRFRAPTTAAAALAGLPVEDRQALLLHGWEELTSDEIAVALDIPLDAVGSRIDRARDQLQLDDELGWLRNSAPSTHDLSDLVRRRERRRLLDGMHTDDDHTADETTLETLPIEGLANAPAGEGEPRPAGPSRNRLVVGGAAAALAVLALAGIALGDTSEDDGTVDGEGFSPLPDTEDPDRTEPAPSTAAGSAPAISIDTAPVPGGLITVTVVRDPGDPAPWPLFELCGVSPPGCMPLWTDDLRQSISTATADLRVPLWFDSPDGILHDCTQGDCELRVTALVTSDTFPLDTATETLRPPETVSPAPGPTVEVSATSAFADGEPIDVAITRMSRRAEVWMCPPADRGDCDSIAQVVADDAGEALVTVQLPRVLPAYSQTVGRWDEYDCAVEQCHIEVREAGLLTGEPILFDPDAAFAPAPLVSIDSVGPYAPGEFLTLSGRGFNRVSSSSPTRVRWVLCEGLPGGIDDVRTDCGTPRTINFTTLDQAGDFDLAIVVPDPATVLTWEDGNALDCLDPCWIVVLTDPFPAVVGVPIEIR